jgi:superfamily II DNA or RNA helicase
MQLRPYQARGKQLVGESFAKGNQAVVLCVPTGGGKTVMFADMTKSSMANGVPVLIMCDRKELIEQANDKLNTFGLFPTLIVPGYRDKASNLYLASVDTLRNRRFPDVGLVVADEAHKKTFDEILLTYKHKGANIVGATATPIRTGKRFFKPDNQLHSIYPKYSGQMGNIYDDMVEPITIPDLLRENYLVPEITYGAELDMTDVDITRNAEGVEYNEQQLFNKFNKPKMYAGVVEKYKELTPGTKAICFNINVEHSKRQTQEFVAAGIPAAHVDGSTPLAVRKKIFKDFHFGIIRVLCNCGVATTGYDEPTIETVIINRCTLSLALYLQMCGRGGRLCPEIGKTYFNIIDMGGNVFKHGFWSEDREWSIEVGFVSRKKGVGVIRECENCQALIPASQSTCSFCNVVQVKREEEQRLIEAKFVILDKDKVPPALRRPLHSMNVEELEKFRELKEYSVGWLVRQLLARGEQALKDYAKMKNYSPGWVYKQLSMAEEQREAVKASIWEFIQENPHVDNEYLKEFSTKKLKTNHTSQQIEFLIPKILEAAADFRTGKIKVE